MSTNALILSGGGARASYQAGVLRAVADILPHLHNPFPIICGTSAGAINATALAAYSGEFHEAATFLQETWRSLEIDHVFKSDGWSLTRGLGKVLASFVYNRIGQGEPFALLDNSPLRDLLTKVIAFDNIAKRIAQGELEALSITALGYSSGESVSFFQGNPALRGWRRYRRVGTPATITVDHLLASSAIPTIFPTVKLRLEKYATFGILVVDLGRFS